MLPNLSFYNHVETHCVHDLATFHILRYARYHDCIVCVAQARDAMLACIAKLIELLDYFCEKVSEISGTQVTILGLSVTVTESRRIAVYPTLRNPFVSIFCAGATYACCVAVGSWETNRSACSSFYLGSAASIMGTL